MKIKKCIKDGSLGMKNAYAPEGKICSLYGEFMMRGLYKMEDRAPKIKLYLARYRTRRVHGRIDSKSRKIQSI